MQLQPFYYSLDDGDLLLHLMCLIDFMCPSEEPATDSKLDGDEERRKQHTALHSYTKENVLPVPVFKALKAEAERLLPPSNLPASRFKHNFSEELVKEFLGMCSSQPAVSEGSSFGVTYLQEQLGLAVAITEKRLKSRSVKAASTGERTSATTKLQDFQEVLPEALGAVGQKAAGDRMIVVP